MFDCVLCITPPPDSCLRAPKMAGPDEPKKVKKSEKASGEDKPKKPKDPEKKKEKKEKEPKDEKDKKVTCHTVIRLLNKRVIKENIIVILRCW